MRTLNIGPRLALAFGLILLVLAGITALSLFKLANLNQRIEMVVHERYPKVQLTERIFEGIRNSSVRLRNVVIASDPERARAERIALAASDAQVGALLADFSARITAEKGRLMFSGLMEAKRRYELSRTAYLDLLENGERDAAATLLLGPLSDSVAAYEARAAELNRLGGALMNQSVEDARDAYHGGMVVISGMSLACLLMAGTLGWWISRSISVPLRYAVDVAETIATGNLASVIETGRRDETGRLLLALRAMNASLAGIVAGVRANAEAISLAAHEIASGTMDLSARTEQQAGSLEETTSSIEALTGSVRHGVAITHEALAVARGAAAVAGEGGAEVREVVVRMAAIEESARRIRDIIGVIDGIAFQTNILALNAAVEAARAGELGRGFAVVAGEVRSLAQRAASAACDVRTLIEDSVDKTEAGVRHARRAGNTMESVLAEIGRVAELMNDIDEASRHQACSIGQINEAVLHIDRATQQNAALVEEAAGAADSMRQGTRDMLESVQVFILDRRPVEPRLLSRG